MISVAESSSSSCASMAASSETGYVYIHSCVFNMYSRDREAVCAELGTRIDICEGRHYMCS